MRYLRYLCLLPVLFTTSVYAQLNVFACEPEWKALVEVLGGEHVQAFSATTAYQDPHYIEARPSLIAKARQADLLVCAGAGLEEGWLPTLLLKANNRNIQPGTSGYFMATDYVLLKEIPTSIDRSQGHIHAAGNPHIHLDPRNMLIIAQPLVERLIEIDPANQADYQQNYDAFKQ